MKLDFNKMSEKEIMNRWLLQGWAIASSLLSLAYGVKGFIIKDIQIVTAIVILAVLNIPLIVLAGTYTKHKNTLLTGIAFPIAYGFAVVIIMFCSKTEMTILYMIPMIVLVMAYTHRRIMILTAVITWAGCLGILIYNTKVSGVWNTTTDEILVYLAGLIATCIFCVISVKVAGRISDHKIDAMNEQTERIKEIVFTANGIANDVNNNTIISNTYLDKIDTSADSMVQAMKETIAGMDNVRQIIESQLSTVREIEDQTKVVAQAATNIDTQVTTTFEQFAEANERMRVLNDSTIKMSDITVDTISSIAELHATINEMSDVIALINSIAAQTRLLSLNASIEAARAGEAGRGFSVVADEIGQLAAQTGTATSDITAKIEALNTMFAAVSDKVEGLITISEEQKEDIQTVSNTFADCHEHISVIDAEAKRQNKEMSALQTRNEQMTEYIEQLSTVDEQVYANALTTSNIAKESKEAIEEIETILTRTDAGAKQLVEVLNK